MILILAGAPGAGKGTQADLLVERDGFRKISTGDALRNQIKAGTEIGKKAVTFMNEGKLVPDDILLDVLKAELNSGSQTKVLLDGYPRNVKQAESLETIGLGNVIKGVMHLDVERQDLIDRLSGRRICSQCGTSFHVTLNPAKVEGTCDRCQGKLVQRPDDSAEKVTVRLDVYDKETKPVLEFYQKKALYKKIDGSGSTESVYQQLRDYVMKCAD